MRRMCSLHQSTPPPQKKKTWCLDRRERCQDHNGMKALPPGTFTGYCVNNTKRAHTKRRPTSTLRVFGARRYAIKQFSIPRIAIEEEEGKEGLGKRPLSLVPASHSLEYGVANVPVGRLLYFLLPPPLYPPTVNLSTSIQSLE